jgi:hypothetical protein
MFNTNCNATYEKVQPTFASILALMEAAGLRDELIYMPTAVSTAVVAASGHVGIFTPAFDHTRLGMLSKCDANGVLDLLNAAQAELRKCRPIVQSTFAAVKMFVEQEVETAARAKDLAEQLWLIDHNASEIPPDFAGFGE